MNVGDIATSLKKTQVVAGARQYALLLSEIWRTSGEAASNLGQLPAGFARAAQTSAFLTQTSDFAHVLLQKVTDATPITAAICSSFTPWRSLPRGFRPNCRGWNAGLKRSQTTCFLTIITALTIPPTARAAARPPPRGKTVARTAMPNNPGAQSQGKYPTLIYDGPFSESTSKAEPLGLTGEVVTEAAAMARAAEFLGSALAGRSPPRARRTGASPPMALPAKPPTAGKSTSTLPKPAGTA